MTIRYGLDAYAYRNTGTYGTPVWTSLNNLLRDVTLNADRSEADVSSRGSGLQCTAGVMRLFSIDAELLYDPDDTGFQALLDSFNGSAGSTIEMLWLDRATATGAEGLRAHMSILKFTKAEPLQGAQMVSANFKPGPYAAGQAPLWYVGA